MKKSLLLLLLLLFSTNLLAQKPKKSFLESNRYSYYTYIYRLTDAQAEFACKNQYNKIEIKNLGQPVDSFVANQNLRTQNNANQPVTYRYGRYQETEPVFVNQYTKKLPLGNYLQVFTQENQEYKVFVPVSNILVDLILNDRDLKIAVTDTLLNIINNAEVFVDGKKISFDKKTQSYQDLKSRKNGFVKVKYQNINYYYSLQKTYATPSFGRKLYFYTIQFPWRYIKKPFKYLKKVTKMAFNRKFREKIKEEKEYQEYYEKEDKQRKKTQLANLQKEKRYIAFSKPMYKPKDTLKLKFMSVLYDNKYDESPYFVYLGEYSNKKLLGTISPYQKGFYEYKLFLHDSLKLVQGKEYELHFYNQKRHKEYLKEVNGDKNDKDKDFEFNRYDERGYFRETFTYKDYELNEITYKARLEHTEHYPTLENRIYLSAKDANDLPIADAKAEIIITKQNINNFPNKTVFIPNELWRTNKTLEPIGETALVLPDSIFKGFDMSYNVKVIFTNAENKRVEQDFAATRLSKRFPVKIELISAVSGNTGKDSLKISYKIPASTNANAGVPVRMSAKNAFGVQKINILDLKLPAKIPFDKNLDYQIETFDKELFNYGNDRDKFSLVTERNQDSVKIAFKNPLLLPVWYEIFEDQKSIKKGFFIAENLVFEDKNRTEKHYFVSCNYPNINTKNGAMIKEEYTIDFNKNELKIIVKQPTKVFPNEKAQIDILVLDHNDKPVADVDVTAYAINNQFPDKKTPQMPYLGKYYGSRKGKRGFKLDKNNTQHKDNLKYSDWEKRIDSLEYYKFLYPKNGVYQASFLAQDSITQFSPYVVKNGKIQPVFYIKVDSYPVFWSIMQNPTYSFHVTEGKHQVEIRTDSSSVILNDVIFEKYKNNILSIGITDDKIQQNKKISVTPQKHQVLTKEKAFLQKLYLSEQERNFLSNYFIKIENNYYAKPFSYIKQNDKIFPIKDRNSGWVGNLTPNNYALFVSPMEKYAHNFVFEAGYSYLFNSNLIKMRSLMLDYEQFNAYYPAVNIFRDKETKTAKFEHSLMSEKRILKDMENYFDEESYTRYYRNAHYKYVSNGCQVNWNMQTDFKKRIQSIILLEMDKDFVKKVTLHTPKDTILNNLGEKIYKMLFLFDKNEFFSTEISPKTNGTNYYFFERMLLQKEDSIIKKIRKQIYFSDADNDITQIKRFLNGDFKLYVDAKIPKNTIKGKIVDIIGEPIPAATIMCKGNPQIATVTNDNGEFILENVVCNTLKITSMGYAEIEISVGNNNIINIRMIEDDQLESVTVSAYGVQGRDKTFANADRAMQGRLADVQVNSSLEQSGSGLNVRIRGISSITSGNQPLYIVDGVQLTSEQFKALNPANIETIEVLKDAASAAIYGAQAAYGIVLVTTNKIKQPKNITPNAENQVIPDFGESRLRNNFRDDAYWKPRLRTDKQGKASFSVTFPDDLTSWHTVVLAASNKLQTGSKIGNIKAFKPLSASIVLPRFLVMEDSVQVLGKTMNYTNDTLAIETHFEVGKTVFPTKKQKLANGNVEKQWLNVTNDNILKGIEKEIEKDSLEVKYVMFQKEYFDGESRKIPVFAKGTKETKGFFANLYKDSLITWKFDKEKGKVKFHAEATLIKVVLDELKHLHEYGYLCNEQAASKLKAYLYHKIIAKKLGKPFLYEKDILSLIKRLQENKNEKQLWGWWGTSTAFGTQMWVSSHVLGVLMMAKTEGYAVNINEELLKQDFLLSLSQEKELYRRLELLETLDKISAKVDYKLFLEEIEKKNAQNKISNKNLTIKLEKERNQKKTVNNTIERYAETLSFQDYLSLQILKQKNSLPFNVDTLFKVKKETMFGNIYWSDNYASIYANSNNVTWNEVQTSLLALKLLKNTKKYEDEQQLCINYLMEKRQNQGYWLNTYESIQIIDILADYIQFSDDKKAIKNPEIVLSGSINKTINTFPYNVEFMPENTFSIQRRQNIKSPLYITAYQTYQNTNPQKEEKYYKVSSEFVEKNERNKNINKEKTITKNYQNDSQNDSQKTTLEAGKPVILRVEIETTKEAKYVLVEIPIPAGCGYANESEETRNNSNREYQRNKVNIFVENFGAGKRVYEIELLPRYTGVFTLNPTRVELMYFPAFFGRNANQKVVIK